MTQAALIVGAGGTLGARIVRLLESSAPGVRVIPASRRGPATLGPEARRVDIHDTGTYAGALEGVGAVVNAVGPYRYDPTPLVRLCVEHGVHYVDLAEGPHFLEQVRLASAEAEAAGVAVVSGCSTVPGLI